MSELFFKAVRPDGGSFNNLDFKWATEPGGVTTHPDYRHGDPDAAHYLSVSTVVTDCTGSWWPARLLVVEAVGEPFAPHPVGLPNKRAAGAFRTVREEPSHLLFGPQGVRAAALIEAAKRLTPAQADALHATWYAVGDAAWSAARDAAVGAAGDAARSAAVGAAGDVAWSAAWSAAQADALYATWDAAGGAARDAAVGVVLRDLVGTGDWTQERYDALTGPWRKVVGPIHPDDADLR